MRCPNASDEGTYTSDSPCTFERKMCVSCRETDSGVVKIKVQTNMMPNHCFTSVSNNAVPKDFEFEVNWQPDASQYSNYEESDFDTQAKTDTILCDYKSTQKANMNSASDYTVIKD